MRHTSSIPLSSPFFYSYVDLPIPSGFYHTMHPCGKRSLQRWLKMLNLPRQSQMSWHRDRLREELQESRLAVTRWQKLSETADVLFSISRAQYDGFPMRHISCFSSLRSTPVYMYMLAKYTSRWSFFKLAALFCNARHWNYVHEVVNPTKKHKLDEVALRHNIDRKKFRRITQRLRQVWPLFP